MPSVLPIALALLLAATVGKAASVPEVIELWPATAPDEPGDIGEESVVMSPALDRRKVEVTEPTRMLAKVSRPTLSVYRPEKRLAPGTAVLVFPGGGYWNLYWQLEGEEVAAWLNSAGITAVLVKYRVPRRPDDTPGEPARRPLQDAQRALRLVRSHADDWGIAPRRIGVIGFSAGGHLAVATATRFDERTYPAVDTRDGLSCRPDFALSIYPGYLATKDRLALSPAIHVPAGTPPIFLAHGDEDPISGPENSVRLYLELKRVSVPAELHVYGGTTHDFGVRRSGRPADAWTDASLRWLRHLGLLDAAP